MIVAIRQALTRSGHSRRSQYAQVVDLPHWVTRAPLPHLIWPQGGIPKVILQDEQFHNPNGKLGNHNNSTPSPTITANNAFFQSLVAVIEMWAARRSV